MSSTDSPLRPRRASRKNFSYRDLAAGNLPDSDDGRVSPVIKQEKDDDAAFTGKSPSRKLSKVTKSAVKATRTPIRTPVVPEPIVIQPIDTPDQPHPALASIQKKTAVVKLVKIPGYIMQKKPITVSKKKNEDEGENIVRTPNAQPKKTGVDRNVIGEIHEETPTASTSESTASGKRAKRSYSIDEVPQAMLPVVRLKTLPGNNVKVKKEGIDVEEVEMNDDQDRIIVSNMDGSPGEINQGDDTNQEIGNQEDDTNQAGSNLGEDADQEKSYQGDDIAQVKHTKRKQEDDAAQAKCNKVGDQSQAKLNQGDDTTRAKSNQVDDTSQAKGNLDEDTNTIRVIQKDITDADQGIQENTINDRESVEEDNNDGQAEMFDVMTAVLSQKFLSRIKGMDESRLRKIVEDVGGTLTSKGGAYIIHGSVTVITDVKGKLSVLVKAGSIDADADTSGKVTENSSAITENIQESTEESTETTATSPAKKARSVQSITSRALVPGSDRHKENINQAAGGDTGNTTKSSEIVVDITKSLSKQKERVVTLKGTIKTQPPLPQNEKEDQTKQSKSKKRQFDTDGDEASSGVILLSQGTPKRPKLVQIIAKAPNHDEKTQKDTDANNETSLTNDDEPGVMTFEVTQEMRQGFSDFEDDNDPDYTPETVAVHNSTPVDVTPAAVIKQGDSGEDTDSGDEQPVVKRRRSGKHTAVIRDIEVDSKKMMSSKYCNMDDGLNWANAREEVLCTLCDKICYNRNLLSKHMKKVHNQTLPREIRSCEICPYKTFHRKDLRRHYFTRHTGREFCVGCVRLYANGEPTCRCASLAKEENGLQCELCSYYTTTKSNLKRHLMKHHTGGYCSVCLKVHINETPQCSCEKSAHVSRCKLCIFVGSSPEYLKNHMRRTHKVEFCDTCVRLYSNGAPTCECVDLSDVYKCEFCNFTSKYKSSVVKHIDDNHSNKRKCQLCSRSYVKGIKQCDCSADVPKSGDSIRRCSFCDFQTIDILFLKKHLDTAHKLSFCQVCATVYSYNKPDCDCNAEVETPELDCETCKKLNRPVCQCIPCDYCNFRFLHKSTLRQHVIREHESDGDASNSVAQSSTYTKRCNLCSFKAPNRTVVKNHLRDYHKVRFCEECFQLFEENQDKCQCGADINQTSKAPDVSLHLCFQCGLTFANNDELTKHSDECSAQNKTLNCTQCEYTTESRDEFQQHLTQIHQSEYCMRCFKTYDQNGSPTCECYPGVVTKVEPGIESEQTTEQAGEGEDDSTDSLGYQCSLCKSTFHQKPLIKQHLRHIHKVKFCPNCLTVYYKGVRMCDCRVNYPRDTLTKIPADYDQNPKIKAYDCRKCDGNDPTCECSLVCCTCCAICKTKELLEEHNDIYHRKKCKHEDWRYQCKICFQLFFLSASYRKHAATHFQSDMRTLQPLAIAQHARALKEMGIETKLPEDLKVQVEEYLKGIIRIIDEEKPRFRRSKCTPAPIYPQVADEAIFMSPEQLESLTAEQTQPINFQQPGIPAENQQAANEVALIDGGLAIKKKRGRKPYSVPRVVSLEDLKDDFLFPRIIEKNELSEEDEKRLQKLTDRPVYHCSLCNAPFGNESMVATHIQEKHPDGTAAKQRKSKPSKEKKERYTLDVYHCPECDFVCTTGAGLTLHYKTHIKPSMYQCELCEYQNVKLGEIQRHIRETHDPKVHPCQACGKMYRTLPLLNKHIKRSHADNSRTCTICSMVLHHPYALARHMERKHPDAPEAGRLTKGNYVCPICGTIEHYVEIYKVHLKMCKRKEKALTCRKDEEMFMVLQNGGVMCVKCDYITKDKGVMRRHFTSKHINRTYECDRCNRTFPQKFLLVKHVQRSHQGKKHIGFCEICNKRFDREYVGKHMWLVHKIMQFSCELCGEEFMNIRYYKRHMRNMHPHQLRAEQARMLTYDCTYPECKLRFNSEAMLRKHARAHMATSQHTTVEEDVATLLALKREEAEAATQLISLESAVQQMVGEVGDQTHIQTEYQLNDPNLELILEEGDVIEEPRPEPQEPEAEEGGDGKIYMCGMCEKVFPSMEETGQHMVKDHGEDLADAKEEGMEEDGETLYAIDTGEGEEEESKYVVMDSNEVVHAMDGTEGEGGQYMIVQGDGVEGTEGTEGERYVVMSSDQVIETAHGEGGEQYVIMPPDSVGEEVEEQKYVIMDSDQVVEAVSGDGLEQKYVIMPPSDVVSEVTEEKFMVLPTDGVETEVGSELDIVEGGEHEALQIKYV